MIKKITSSPKHHFFGYYDLCPWSESGELLLGLETDLINRAPDGSDVATIGVIDDEKFNPVGETRSWNFQQGCRLQWLSGNEIIFNDVDGAVILDIESGKRRQLSHHIYSVHPNKNVAITSNMSRIHRFRKGYGYDVSGPENGDVMLLDLKNRESKTLISLDRIMDLGSMSGDDHWLNYMAYNASGSKIVFFHRYGSDTGGLYTRVLVCDSDGSDVRALLESGMASHYTWKNEDKIVVWGRWPGTVSNLLKENGLTRSAIELLRPIYSKLPLYSRGVKSRLVDDSFIQINVNTGDMERVGEDVLNEDGHPSFSHDGRHMITDTYPDNHKSSLLLYNTETKEKRVLAKVNSLPKDAPDDWDYSELRCDLHPRWSRDGKKICFDSVDDGTRQIYVVEI